MIAIRVQNVKSAIVGVLDPHHVAALDKILAYYVEGYFHSLAYKRGFYNAKTGKWNKWDGKKHLLTKKLRFPSGVLHYVTAYLKKADIPFLLEDLRIEPEKSTPIPLAIILDDREYQERCIKSAIDEKNCIIEAATGSGKSYIAANIMARLNVKSVIYVHTKDLLRQMMNDMKTFLGLEPGQIGDGTVNIQHITVAMIQTVSQAFDTKYVKYDDEEMTIKDQLKMSDKEQIRNFVQDVDLFIFDEAHHVSSDSCQVIAVNSKKARYRLGMSGTAWRDDGADLLIEAATGKKVAKVPATELINLGILTRPNIYVYNLDEYVGKEKNYKSIYNDYIASNSKRNTLICQLAYQMVKKKHRVMISVKFISHGKILYDMLKQYMTVEFVRGELDSNIRDDIKKSFEAGQIQVIIATSLYDEGINIPALDSIILAGGGKSSTRALQRIGRTLRKYPGKEKSTVIDFIDNAPFLLKHSKKRIKMYETESGFNIKYVD